MCVCVIVFLCNVCVFLFSIVASFVTYNSTNLHCFFFISFSHVTKRHAEKQ